MKKEGSAYSEVVPHRGCVMGVLRPCPGKMELTIAQLVISNRLVNWSTIPASPNNLTKKRISFTVGGANIDTTNAASLK